MIDPRLNLASTLLDMSRNREAMTELSTYLAAHPDDVTALCLSARALIGLGQHSRALEFAQRAATLAPGIDWPLRLVSIAHARLGNGREAVYFAEQSVRVDPTEWRTHYQVAQARLMTDRVTHVASTAIDEAVRLAPDEPEVHRAAGFVNARLGNRKAAEAAFRRALSLDPSDAVARHELARLSLQRGRLVAAADGFANAVALDPSMDTGVHNLDVLTTRSVRYLHYATFGATVLAGGLARGAVIVAAVVSVACVGTGLWLWRRLGRQLGRYVRRLPRRAPKLVAWAVLLLVCLSLTWLTALVSHRFLLLAIALLWVGVFLGRSWNHDLARNRRLYVNR